MIRITVSEFNELREGIAGAHIFIQTMYPLLKARHTTLDKDQRNLLAVVPESVARAFNLAAVLTQRLQGKPGDPAAQLTLQITDLDVATIREEIENVSALNLPDLNTVMTLAFAELPGLATHNPHPDADPLEMGMALAIVWEAGRRYGLQQAMAIFDNTSADYLTGTGQALQFALDSTLDLPAPELPLQLGEAIPFPYTNAGDPTKGDDGATDTAPLDFRTLRRGDRVN